MKKLLAILTTSVLTITPVTTIISCNKSDDWNNIPVDIPVLPLEVTGFEGINFKTINPQDSKQTIPKLLEQLAQLFQGSKWNFNQLVKNYKFNNQSKAPSEIDLYRNGNYELNFNDGTTVNTIKINKTVITSNHLADKIKSIDLGVIDDARPKTILIAIVFNNMQLISELDKFGEFFIGEQTPKIWNQQISQVPNIVVNKDQTEAILKTGKDHWSEHDDPTKDYYGSITIHFSVKTPEPPVKQEDLGAMKLTTNLGKLPKVTILQTMMMFISANFVSQLKRLSALLNDLYLTINDDQKGGTIVAYDHSKYYTGEVELTFN
ncbi:MAG: hypothetical protein EIB84_06805 [Spiroplasma poulsonii]|uniref:Lipoprotein n=1 Tax=Spiroplasma poulsonii TaxID=2138 RepID=A0A2P6FCP6_9MOLU|nr:lipoprotein [Spiroplasma poulsonii]KAF0851637.1 putative lipoprotein [Spiroplasma poulsonii]MBW1242456.1 hypothetical protein [Spiroplasma poulsonii]PQM31235.1 hypothetical protein SMSRO_SF010500 [Spiroplasma poulsonii]PWF96238.1 hypothetical protein SMSE_16850 [Spiroplasma poulsonii]PWF99013.1 hypothetical protein SMH99_15850 [Spiroplasma poulsonii]